MDRGARQAVVHRITKSQTHLALPCAWLSLIHFVHLPPGELSAFYLLDLYTHFWHLLGDCSDHLQT